MKVALVHHNGLVMALGGFTLADRLGAKTMPCRVPGCTRTWLQFGGKAALSFGARTDSAPGSPGAGMCDPCKKKLSTLTEKQRRCDVPGCENTWTWPVEAQMEAFASHRPPPKNLCASCEQKLSALEDKEVACTVPGCTRTATLSKRSQLLAQSQAETEAKAEAAAAEAAAAEAVAAPAEAPPEAAAQPEMDGAEASEASQASQASQASIDAPAEAQPGSAEAKTDEPRPEKPGRVTYEGPLCEPCSDVARRLQDRPVTCGINGCKRKWIWKADDQLQAFAAGKPNEPPRRMCETCRTNFGKLADREVRCRTSGCKKTWTWSRFDQLDACVADKPPPKAPARMCDSCYDLFQSLKDVERPCRKSGCKRTWTDKRGAQLARLVRGKTGDPYPQYCNECRKELGDLEDREISCKTEGCPGTWTWSREQQLAAGVRPSPKAEDRVEAADKPAATAEAAPAPEAPAPQAPSAEAPTQPVAAIASSAGVEVITAPAAVAPAPAPGKTSRKEKKRKQRQIQPPERLCHACGEFLKDRKTLEIPCSQCGTSIYWPPESQLQTHLGNWAQPTMCGACKRDATEAARRAAKEALRQQVIDASHSHDAPAEGAAIETPSPPAEPSSEPPPSENQPS
jgi:hypothetical protein